MDSGRADSDGLFSFLFRLFFYFLFFSFGGWLLLFSPSQHFYRLNFHACRAFVKLDLDHLALRPQKRGGLLGTGTGGGGGGEDERVKARPRIPLKKRPERPWTAARTMEVLRRCPLAIAQRLVQCAVAVSTAVLGSHKDNVRCTAVQEQPEAKEVQLSQPSSTSLLMISSGLT